MKIPLETPFWDTIGPRKFRGVMVAISRWPSQSFIKVMVETSAERQMGRSSPLTEASWTFLRVETPALRQNPNSTFVV